jgi:hypothetical protein
MPWFVLYDMSTQNVRAFYRFVRTLGPAVERAPAYLPPGREPIGPVVVSPTHQIFRTLVRDHRNTGRAISTVRKHLRNVNQPYANRCVGWVEERCDVTHAERRSDTSSRVALRCTRATG